MKASTERIDQIILRITLNEKEAKVLKSMVQNGTGPEESGTEKQIRSIIFNALSDEGE